MMMPERSGIPGPWHPKCARLTPTSKRSRHFGATMDNIVDEILFVVDMDAAMKARGRLKDEVFGQAILPAATIVQIQRLALPDFMVEIRVIARV